MATHHARKLSLIKKKSNFIKLCATWYYLLTAKVASQTLWGAVDDGLRLLKSETRTSCFKRSIIKGFILGLKIAKESISQFLDITITERLICTWIKKGKKKHTHTLKRDLELLYPLALEACQFWQTKFLSDHHEHFSVQHQNSKKV